MKFFPVLFLFLIGFANADVIVNETSVDIANAYIVGAITSSDYDSVVEKTKGKTVIYYLDSNGGSVDTAMKIGRLIRRSSGAAFVTENSKCLSACVLILAGAARRSVEGKVGIHRLYERNGTETSPVAQKEKYNLLGKKVKSFLNEMNIPEKLYDDMLPISPEKVRILSDSELAAYGLNENDPFIDEASATKQAQKLGISRQEYAKRLYRANFECHSDSTSTDESDRDLVNYVIEADICRSEILKGTR